MKIQVTIDIELPDEQFSQFSFQELRQTVYEEIFKPIELYHYNWCMDTVASSTLSLAHYKKWVTIAKNSKFDMKLLDNS